MAATEPRPRRSWSGNRNSIFGGIIAVLIIVGVALLALWILENRRDDGESLLGGNQPQTVSEVLSDPAASYGQNIIVSGEVQEIVNPIAFIISDPIWTEGGSELLVIAPAPSAAAEGALDETLYADAVVQVTGVLHQYDATLVEQQLGATVEELQLEALQRYEGQPVLIGELSGLTPRVTAGDGTQASVDEIMSNPAGYFEERVVLSGEVTQVLSDHAFVLDGNLLVLDATGEVTQQAFEASTELQVSGVVRELSDPSALSREYDIALDTTQIEQYQGEPVLIGEVITIVR